MEKLFFTYKRGSDLILVSEYNPCTLSQFFNENGGPGSSGILAEPIVKFYLYQTLTIIADLHAKGFVHCNISTMCIQLRETGQVKIGGLERVAMEHFSRHKNEDQHLSSREGVSGETPEEIANLAPELLLGHAAKTYATDMWSIGCVFYQMLTSCHPFYGIGRVSVLFKIFRLRGSTVGENILDAPTLSSLPFYIENYNHFPRWQAKNLASLPGFEEVSADCIDLLQSLLELEPSKRISAREALHHRYF